MRLLDSAKSKDMVLSLYLVSKDSESRSQRMPLQEMHAAPWRSTVG
jgi:hypothetical protein